MINKTNILHTVLILLKQGQTFSKIIVKKIILVDSIIKYIYSYGPVINLFTLVNKKIHIPIEVVGGGKLFHCVVEDYNLCTKLINLLHKYSSGRVTLLPLKQLPNKSEIKADPNKAILIKKLIKYDKKFENVLKKYIKGYVLYFW